jgi:hypothetical protein
VRDRGALGLSNAVGEVWPQAAEHERQRFHRDDRLRFPKACDRLDRDWARMLTYYQFPKEHWRHLRTMNVVESPFAAVRLRTSAAKRVKKGERALFDEVQAAGMLTRPHSGFHVHTAVWVPEDYRAFATRLARYCARNPVALERLTDDRIAKAVTYRSDKMEGPTAGTETADPLEFQAHVLVHIPDKGQVTTRTYGWYVNRPRGMRGKVEPAAADGPAAIAPAPRMAPTEASRRWAALLQQRFAVGPLACPTCHGAMRIITCIT